MGVLTCLISGARQALLTSQKWDQNICCTLTEQAFEAPSFRILCNPRFDLTLISQLHNLFSSTTEFLKLRNRNASVKKPAQRKRASRESFSNRPYMLLRCWGKEWKKAKRTHLHRGGGGFLTIDRNLLLSSNRKHLTIPQNASRTTTSTSSRRCKSSHSRETQLISSRFSKITPS